VQHDAVVGEVEHAVDVAVGARVEAAFPSLYPSLPFRNPSHIVNLGYATLKTDEGLGA